MYLYYLALFHLWFGSPREEGDHVLGHLRHCGGRAVRVLDGLVHQRGRHTDRSAREIRVVVGTLLHRGETGSWLAVPGEQAEEVVLTIRPRYIAFGMGTLNNISNLWAGPCAQNGLGECYKV